MPTPAFAFSLFLAILLVTIAGGILSTEDIDHLAASLRLAWAVFVLVRGVGGW